VDEPSIRDIRLFVAAAQTGSLSAGSRSYGLSANAASVAVKRLEERMQTRLFHRTTRSLTLTTEGRVYLERCRGILQAVDAAHRSIGPLRDTFTGPIRISAPSDLGRRTLLPILDAFCALHPQVQLDVSLADDLLSIIDARIDIAIRYGRLDDSGLVAKRLLLDRRVAVASPAYLETAPPITRPTDLAAHRILMWRRPGRRMDQWTFEGADGAQTIRVDGHRTANDGAVLRAWALSGHGIAFKARLDVLPELIAGTLVDVLPDWRGVSLPLQAVMAGRDYRPARVQRLLSHLLQHLADLEEAMHGALDGDAHQAMC
jgi:DNA-binding transcriptional LysR family regulator